MTTIVFLNNKNLRYCAFKEKSEKENLCKHLSECLVCFSCLLYVFRGSSLKECDFTCTVLLVGLMQVRGLELCWLVALCHSNCVHFAWA